MYTTTKVPQAQAHDQTHAHDDQVPQTHAQVPLTAMFMRQGSVEWSALAQVPLYENGSMTNHMQGEIQVRLRCMHSVIRRTRCVLVRPVSSSSFFSNYSSIWWTLTPHLCPCIFSTRIESHNTMNPSRICHMSPSMKPTRHPTSKMTSIPTMTCFRSVTVRAYTFTFWSRSIPYSQPLPAVITVATSLSIALRSTRYTQVPVLRHLLRKFRTEFSNERKACW